MNRNRGRKLQFIPKMYILVKSTQICFYLVEAAEHGPCQLKLCCEFQPCHLLVYLFVSEELQDMQDRTSVVYKLTKTVGANDCSSISLTHQVLRSLRISVLINSSRIQQFLIIIVNSPALKSPFQFNSVLKYMLVLQRFGEIPRG